MRISTHVLHQQGIDAILKRQSELQRTELQLATGKRILKPSDDPSSSAVTVGLDQTTKVHEQYLRNSERAESRLTLEESVLGSVANALQRARELAIQANNGNMSLQEREAIAVEVDEILEQVMGFANTKDGNGDYLFAGLKGDTIPFVDGGGGVFTYQGDQGQRKLQVGPTRTVADADSGFAVFMDLQDAGGAPKDMFSMLDDLRTGLRANVVSGAPLGELDSAIEKVSDIRANVGARLNAIDNERQHNEAVVLNMQSVRSELNDLDYAEAISRFNLQMTGLQAAQQAYTKVQGLSLFNYL